LGATQVTVCPQECVLARSARAPGPRPPPTGTVGAWGQPPCGDQLGTTPRPVVPFGVPHAPPEPPVHPRGRKPPRTVVELTPSGGAPQRGHQTAARAQKWVLAQSARPPGPRHPSYRYRGVPGAGVSRGSVGRRVFSRTGRHRGRGSAPRRNGRPEGGRSTWGPPRGPCRRLNQLPLPPLPPNPPHHPSLPIDYSN
jgi:hypothetical protein